MKLPKWLVLALMLLAAFAAVTVWVNDVFSAENAPHNLRTFATEAGLPTDFEIDYEEGDPEAYYTNGGIVCIMFFLCMEMQPHIYVSMPADWPREYVLVALFHEIGHYHQRSNGQELSEWGADEFAVRHLCSLGMNGPELVAGALSALTPYVEIESPRHGNHYRRVDNARSRGCNGRGLEMQQAG
jgi:hypothetical protein